MNSGAQADGLYLDRLVELIELLSESLAGLDQERFLADRTLGDATALRLGAIGELGRKLSDELKARHAEVEWARMYRLRNIVAHHYDRLDYAIIWEVATTALEPLRAACRLELDRLAE